MTKRIWALWVFAALMGINGGDTSRVLGEGGAPTGVSGVMEKSLTPEQVKALIEKFGADDFKARTAAKKELVAAGPAVLAALDEAAASKDVEVAALALGAAQEIRRVVAAAASAALAKRHLWRYTMDDGAVWSNGGAWPVISGETAYVVGTESNLHAVELQTGRKRWTANVGPQGMAGVAIPAQVSVGDKVVSVVELWELVVCETTSGKELWRKDFKALNAMGPAARRPVVRVEAWVVGDLVIARMGDQVNAYDAQNGKDAWQMNVKKANTFCNAIVADGVLYLATENAVAAVDLAGRKELWSREMPGCLHLVKSGQTLVCVAAGTVAALDSSKGDKIWEAVAEGAGAKPVQAGRAGPDMALSMMRARSVAVDESRVYVLVVGSMLTFDLKTGRKSVLMLDLTNESQSAPATPGGDDAIQGATSGAGPGTGGKGSRFSLHSVTASEGTVYGVVSEGIIAFDGTSGTRLWMLPLPQPPAAGPVAAGGVLYFATTGRGEPAPENAAPDVARGTPLSQPGLHAVKLAK